MNRTLSLGVSLACLLIGLVCLVCIFCGDARAGEWHQMEGVVIGTKLFGSKEPEPESWAVVAGHATDPLPVWTEPRLDLELQLMHHWQGLAVGLRWDLGEHWLVFGGTGAGRLAADLDWQRDGFNFLLQAGVGYRLGKWRADVRWHHISNARLRQPNTGTNGVLLLLGRTW